MEMWKMLLITLLSAVLLGCAIGVAVGKHQVKKRRPDYRPLLSAKERIIYSACILLGAGCIAFGLLYTPPAEDPGIQVGDDGMVIIGGEGTEGEAVESEVIEGEAGSGGGTVTYNAGPGVRSATRSSFRGGSVVVMG